MKTLMVSVPFASSDQLQDSYSLLYKVHLDLVLACLSTPTSCLSFPGTLCHSQAESLVPLTFFTWGSFRMECPAPCTTFPA